MAAIDVRQAGFDSPLQRSLTAYAAGDWDEAISLVDFREVTTGRFLDGLDQWIHRGGELVADDRRMIACAFALDTVWKTTRGPFDALRGNVDPWGRVTPDRPDRVMLTSHVAQGIVASWVAKTLGQTQRRPEKAELERLLWLAAVSVASDGSAWHRLREEVLPIASARLVGEPRLAFAATLSAILPDVGALRTLDLLHRGDVLHQEPLSASARKKIPEAIAALDKIRSDSSLGWEADLWAGYFYLRLNNWNLSLERLERARSAPEPEGVAMAAYLSGWVYEQRVETDDAILAYRRALTAMPNQQEVVWRLAALLYLSHRREEAYELLNSMPASTPKTRSLLVTLERGDGRLAVGLLTSIRRALR